MNLKRKERDKPPYKDGDRLTKEEYLLVNSERERNSKEKFPLGRKLVLKEDFRGRNKGTVCWVVSEWPRTIVLYEDGSYRDLCVDFTEILYPTDEFIDDVDKLITKILKKNKRN